MLLLRGFLVFYDSATLRPTREYYPGLDHILALSLHASGERLLIVEGPVPQSQGNSLLLFDVNHRTLEKLATGRISGCCWDASGKEIYISFGFLDHHSDVMPTDCYVSRMSPSGAGQETRIDRGMSITATANPGEFAYLDSQKQVVLTRPDGKREILSVPRNLLDLRYLTDFRFVVGGQSLILRRLGYWGNDAYLLRRCPYITYTTNRLVLAG